MTWPEGSWVQLHPSTHAQFVSMNFVQRLSSKRVRQIEIRLRYMVSEPTWEAVNFLNFRGGGMPPDPPISFCTLRESSYKRGVPAMLCPSNGDVLATPLLCTIRSRKKCGALRAPHGRTNPNLYLCPGPPLLQPLGPPLRLLTNYKLDTTLWRDCSRFITKL